MQTAEGGGSENERTLEKKKGTRDERKTVRGGGGGGEGRCRGGGREGVRRNAARGGGGGGGGGKVRETVGRRDEMSKGVMIGGDESLQMSHHISTRRADGVPNIMRYSLIKGSPSHFQTPGRLPYFQVHQGRAKIKK